MIIGDLTSGVTLSIAPIAETNKVVLLAPGASNPKVREAGDFIFRNWASDNFDGKIVADYLLNKLKKKNAAIIFINNEYGKGLADAFEDTFVSNGGTVTLKEFYHEGETDFRSIIAKLQEINYDSIFLPGQPKENGLLVKQLYESRISSVITANLSVESPTFHSIAKDSGKGIIFSTPAFDVRSSQSTTAAFINEYESEYGRKPDVVAGHGYDAAMILIKAIKNSNYDFSNLKNELYKIQNFPGVTGITSFDSKGDVIKSVMVKKLIGDGNSIILDQYFPQQAIR